MAASGWGAQWSRLLHSTGPHSYRLGHWYMMLVSSYQVPLEEPMTHLRNRRPPSRTTTWISIGMRGQQAADIAQAARAYALARGVTFGSLVLQALSDYLDARDLEAQAAAAEAKDR